MPNDLEDEVLQLAVMSISTGVFQENVVLEENHLEYEVTE